MAHVVTEKCNGCKFTDCVEVCPVACFYEMDTQVVIHPDDCIDCMACVEVCPVHAIYADADVPTEYTKDIEYNAVEAVQIKDSGAPAITVRKDALPTANDLKKALGYYVIGNFGTQEKLHVLLRRCFQPVDCFRGVGVGPDCEAVAQKSIKNKPRELPRWRCGR